MNKRTIVIGNGFDLNLGLKTSYAHFIKSHYFQNLLDKNELCKYLYEKYKKCNWVDIEVALVNYPYMNNQNQYNLDYHFLREALVNYLKNIETNNDYKEKKAYKFMIEILNDCCQNTFETTILNFNYTSTITKIIEEYKEKHHITDTSQLRIYNKSVHGRLEEKICFGYNGENPNKERLPFIKKTYQESFANPISDLLSCDDLHIWGHSLGESDGNLFKTFFSETNRKHISIYYHGVKGLNEIKNRIEVISGYKNENLMNNIHFKNTMEHSSKTNTKNSFYTVPIYIDYQEEKRLLGNIDIKESYTVQEVLDIIYIYYLKNNIEPYTYMDSWVLKERKKDVYMIMHEITTLVPAKYIFKQNLEWEVVKWDENYKAVKSKHYAGFLYW